MSATVEFDFYQNVYMGQDADPATFSALCARAADIIGAMAHWRVTDENIAALPEHVRTLYKKAVCAQIDGLIVNGTDGLAATNDRGFTVGKVSVSGKSGSDLVRKGVMSGNIAPLAVMYLEQTGLLNPAVAVLGDMPLVGW